MEFRKPHCSAHCTHEILSPDELEGLLDIWIEHIREYFSDPIGMRTRPDWNVILHRFNVKFPRATLTRAQLLCALKGKQTEIQAALNRAPIPEL